MLPTGRNIEKDGKRNFFSKIIFLSVTLGHRNAGKTDLAASRVLRQ